MRTEALDPAASDDLGGFAGPAREYALEHHPLEKSLQQQLGKHPGVCHFHVIWMPVGETPEHAGVSELFSFNISVPEKIKLGPATSPLKIQNRACLIGRKQTHHQEQHLLHSRRSVAGRRDVAQSAQSGVGQECLQLRSVLNGYSVGEAFPYAAE